MSPGGRNTRAKVLLEWSGRFKMEFLQDGVQKQTRQRARTSDNGSGKRFGPDELYAMCMQSVCRAWTPHGRWAGDIGSNIVSCDNTDLITMLVFH